MKNSESLSRIATEHFNNLKTNLENQDKKKQLEIIEYLINFLGCLTISILLETITWKELSKNKHNPNYTAWEWQYHIEKWIATYYSSNKRIRALLSIKREFMQEGNDLKLHAYIDQWRRLRNYIEHKMPLINGTQLTDYLINNFFQLQTNFDLFVRSLINIIKEYPSVLKSDLFYLQNETLYIYSSIDENGYVEYVHYSFEPVNLQKDNFPLSYDVVFLSLSPTAKYLLAGKDVIQVKMITNNSTKFYENDFELLINNKLVKTVRHSYKNGDKIIFPLPKLIFQEGHEIQVRIKALRNGKIQADDSKLVEIYSKVPEINSLETQAKEIPIGKVSRISLFLRSVFEVKNIRIESFEISSEYISVLSKEPNFDQVQDTLYRTTFDVISTHIGAAYLDVNISYINIEGIKIFKNINGQIVSTLNFFEPDFVGEERKNIISKMLLKRNNYFIAGEGGVGKSRLIDEYFKLTRNRTCYKITVQPFEGLALQFAHQLGICIEKKKDAFEDIYQKVIKCLKEKVISGKMMDFWISDCHEITNNKDILFLRSIAQICVDSEYNIMLILESRDKSWSDTINKLLNELKQTDIISIELKRMNAEEQISIIDSIFIPNKFDVKLKNTLIKKSDGIIYILLRFLQYLNKRGLFLFEENQIWSHKLFAEYQDLLKGISYSKVLKENIEDCFRILDVNGLGKYGRDILRYLCFGSIPKTILIDFLECDMHSFQNTLDILERDGIIKRAQNINERQEHIYEFHHQIKKDYFWGNLFPSYMKPDYYADVFAMHTEYLFKNNDGTDNHFELFTDDFKDLSPFEDFLNEEKEEHLKDEYKKLSEPRLRKKVKWLLFMASEESLRNTMVEILYQYASILDAEDILYALDELFFDCYRIEFEGEMVLLHTVNFHNLRKLIEQIFYINKMDDFEQYQDNHYRRLYFNIKIRIEIEDLLLTLHETYKIIDFNNYPHFFELSTPIFKLTDTFLNNTHFLLEIYKILENIYLYFEFAKEYDAPERYLRLHNEIDIYKSFVHLLALLLITKQDGKSNYTVQYLLFLDKLLAALPEMKMVPEVIEFLNFHKKFVLSQYPTIAYRISDLIHTG